MQGRIQLILILSLFVLAGSLEGTSFRSDAGKVHPALKVSMLSDSHTAVHNYFSVAICPSATSIETSIAPSDHKAVVRQLAGTRAAASAAYDVHTVMRTCFRALHADAVDYYVFSLGRIRI